MSDRQERETGGWQRAYVLWLLDRDPVFAAKLIRRWKWTTTKTAPAPAAHGKPE